MDSKILKGAVLSYLAVYDQNLREELEECGLISESVVDEGKLPLDKERRDRIGRQIGRRTYSSSPKKYDEMEKMKGALKSAQKNEELDVYVDEERAPGVKPYKPGPSQAEVRADAAAARRKHVSGAAKQSGYGPEDKFKSDWKLRATPSSTSKRKDGSVETVSQRMDREKPYGKRMTGELARKQGSRIASAVTRTIEGPGEPQAVTMPRQKAKVSKEIIRKEEMDIYDIILSHLLDEGYATSVDAAEKIMVNMSEQWIESILG